MYKAIALAVLFAYADARFGQENIPIDAISAIDDGGAGLAATIAGEAISDLLGGANACDKLVRADDILAQLGEGADAVAAAIGLVAAEKNFNNFEADQPTVCAEIDLPANPLLKGITPLIDPGVDGADIAIELSAQTADAPLDADGLSVADLLIANGFDNFIAETLDGATEDQAGAAADAPADCEDVVVAEADDAEAAADAEDDAEAEDAEADDAEADDAAADDAEADDAAADDAEADVAAGANFGVCNPAIFRAGGLNGRPADEFTFQAVDPLISEGQQEALNPNIICNRVCDQLVNVCEANQAGVDACLAAQADVEASGLRDDTIVDLFNDALGVSAKKERKLFRFARS
ncbi:hypothetical protein BDY21DRAFT_147560 [Lineolata rhizophorae]|uniref:Uncharacterized protein n=1 Tax=Lineolata rhizophorae TaxID=578093 RepID=A0A6A6NNR2_9PEZI|nr:hypothetical protein BDY21DRAFT_147560 [Lineolata rhizophorae]